MKFAEIKYERPNYLDIKNNYDELLNKLEKTDNKEDFLKVFFEIQDLGTNINLMYSLSYIRHSINTKDEFYEKENEYWDETMPLLGVFESRLSKILISCPFKDELYDEIPEPLFKIAEYQIKSFDEKIIPLLQKENKLTTEYGKLKASAQIEFEGKIYNLSTLYPYTESLDRDIRKKATDARIKFYVDHEKEFDSIFDELVKIRHQMALELGFDSYTELGYLNMKRLDYNQEMVANYRKQILNNVVPSATKLYERQAKRLGLDKLSYFDKNIEFLSGNPTPKGNQEELIQSARKMYHEMSKETAEFIDNIIDNEFWDLLSRDGKEMGGYCALVPKYNLPFIFANFNGTSGDVEVLTHEAGHAFQYYMSRNIKINDLISPTLESAEIHSMTMEFNAYPWLELFFKEDADKYKFSHLSYAIKFLPYAALVDHFQHEIYNNPNMSIEDRKKCWRDLEKQYIPHEDYEGCDFFQRGNYWFSQGHIFEVPFYYIDYALAQICALQFWVRNYNHDENSWKDYLHLCSLGGTKTFTQLVKEANLISPFEDNCVESIINDINKYLNDIDDTKF